VNNKTAGLDWDWDWEPSFGALVLEGRKASEAKRGEAEDLGGVGWGFHIIYLLQYQSE
jgi:hypothetical protein